MAEIETRNRIPIWRAFGQIQWHVIPEPPATLQGAATCRIECHDPRATCHIAGCCYLANSMSWYHSHLPHCRVLPPAEFNVMIPELRVTLQGAAAWRIQGHFIPEPRFTLQARPTATWWIHCHDSRATCQIAGCSHLAKSMWWSCHIAGCKNSIRHIKNWFFAIFFCHLNAVWALTSGGFRIVSDTLVTNNTLDKYCYFLTSSIECSYLLWKTVMNKETRYERKFESTSVGFAVMSIRWWRLAK